MKKIYFPFSLLSLAASAILLIYGNNNASGILAVVFFILLVSGFQTSTSLKGYTFTLSIFAAATCALYFPQYFLQWGDFKLRSLVIPLLQVIMFGMGTSMKQGDFAAILKNPKGVMIGVASHFIIMPSFGFLLAKISGFSPEIAAGIILVGCSPSGLASNVMAYLGRANLALSITVTAVTTMLAPFITPVLMKLLAGSLININVANMMLEIAKMIIIPIVLGLLFNKIIKGRTGWLVRIMPVISMIAIALIIIVITAAGRNSLLTIGPLLIILVLAHNLFGYLLGYYSARLFKMPESDARTVALEVGLQNAGLASGIAQQLGMIATLGLAAGVFGPVMNITGSILASYWHKREPRNK